MVLEFSNPIGPFFHYEPPTNETFGDQPHLKDPLDKKYMLVAKSNISPNAGEGAFAIRDIPTNTFFSLYGGMLYTPYQYQILEEQQNKLISKNRTVHSLINLVLKYQTSTF